MENWKYHYSRRRDGWRIYLRGEHGSTPVAGEPIYYDPELARKRVYELNGWQYKPRKS